jgi:hypothetical protein
MNPGAEEVLNHSAVEGRTLRCSSKEHCCAMQGGAG